MRFFLVNWAEAALRVHAFRASHAFPPHSPSAKDWYGGQLDLTNSQIVLTSKLPVVEDGWVGACVQVQIALNWPQLAAKASLSPKLGLAGLLWFLDERGYTRKGSVIWGFLENFQSVFKPLTPQFPSPSFQKIDCRFYKTNTGQQLLITIPFDSSKIQKLRKRLIHVTLFSAKGCIPEKVRKSAPNTAQ